MAARDNGGLREQAERLVLAALGAVALTGERVEQLAEELSERAGIKREEASRLVSEAVDAWRAETTRFGDWTGDTARRVVADLGLATREEVDDLELRVAQLEHRLKLVERAPVD